MFSVKIKYEGKSRRLKESIKTVEDLRKRIGELYGPQAATLHILYKDCDNELVSIVDNEDLANCYEEATDLGDQSITLLVQARIRGSRSASSKKSSSSSFNSVSFDTDEETEVKANAKNDNQKVFEQADAAKKQIQAEFEAKLAAVNAQAEAARQTIAAEKQKENSRSKSGRKCGENKGPCGGRGGAFKFMRKLGFMKRSAEQKGLADPMEEVKGVFEQFKEKCPGLMITPQLFKEVMSRSLPQIAKTIEESYQQALIANPNLKQEIEAAKAEFQQMKENSPWGRGHWGRRHEGQEGHHEGHHTHGRWGHHGHKHHGHHFGHHQSPQESQCVNAPATTIEEKTVCASTVTGITGATDKKQCKSEREQARAEKQKLREEKEKAKAAKEAEKQKKIEEKERARNEKLAEKEKRKLEKESEKEVLKETVKKLRKEFPRMNKEEVIALAKENFQTLTFDQLKQHIQNYRIAKSTTH